RLPIKAHKSGLFDQALAYRSFFFGAQRACRGQQWDLVYATSSRLMTGFTGARIARPAGAPFVLDIRDLFVDTMGDLLRGNLLRLTLPIFRLIERYTFATATKVSTVSEAFVPYLRVRGVTGPIEFFPNGIDSLFLEEPDQPAATDSQPSAAGPKRLVYVGNIGDGQGLDRILPEAAAVVHGKWEFHLVGYGGAIAKLKARITELGVTNIVFHDPVPRTEVPAFYRDADALFLHLNEIPAFERVIPSKIFEYGAGEKPVIPGVAGYPARFISTNLPDVLLFDPCDVQALVKILSNPLPRISSDDRGEFVTRFRREAIMARLAAWITADL
ncbi:MAG: glycosyltransferase family 4 protein, partial [Alkalispirochaeta sp.]